jgi:hypothetical protein
MAHPSGRPTKYTEDFIPLIDEYVKQNQDEWYQLTKTDGVNTTSFENRVRVKLPTLEGFAHFLGVSRRSIFEWKDKYPIFSHSLEKIEEEQRQRLINSGLSGDYSPVIAKLLLSNNFGMKERSDLTTDDEKFPTPIYGGKSV